MSKEHRTESGLETRLTKENLRTVAQQECDELLEGTDKYWPDCWHVSRNIEDRLIKDGYVTPQQVTVFEYKLESGYVHYAVEVQNWKRNESYIIDASFRQFASEMDTPISLGPDEEISEVVIVSPSEAYIFHDDRVGEVDPH